MEAENNITKQMKEAARNAESKPFPGMDSVWEKVTARLDEEIPKKKVIPFFSYKKMIAAAAVLVLIGVGTGYFLASKNDGITIAVNNYPAAAKTTGHVEKIANEVSAADKTMDQEGAVTLVDKAPNNHLSKIARHNNKTTIEEVAAKENNSVPVIHGATLESLAALPVTSIFKGTIVDENGEGVAGAYVKIKGTNVFTQTDVDGNYELQIKTPQPTIEINSLGYESKEIIMAGNYTSGKIQLAPNKEVLTEVVASTYGPPTTRSKYIGAADVIKSKQMEHTPVTDLTKTIRGISPGMQIPNGNDAVVGITSSPALNNNDMAYQNIGNVTTTNGLAAQNPAVNPGLSNTYGSINNSAKLKSQNENMEQRLAINRSSAAHASKTIDEAAKENQVMNNNYDAGLQIRGKGSLSKTETPMYIVDGVSYNGDVNAIKPEDIISVNVLTDSMASDLYGAKGKNGVVVIVTKSKQYGAGPVQKKQAIPSVPANETPAKNK
jgi:hypothetical protein